jgi:acyl-CoA synthetase (NDP forming)
VAIVGASNDAGRLTGLTVRYLKEAGFKGDVWPVNPNREEVQGLKAYPSVAALPAAPDVGVIVVPLALVQQAVADLAAKGAKAAMVFTTGFGETDGQGVEAQQALVDIAKRAGMRLLGPNCLGGFNSEAGFYGTFAISLNKGLHTPGNVAVVSQSGAYGEQICYLAKERGLGVRYFLSTGNEADIELGEVISWLTHQPEIDVIVAYAEGTRRPDSLKAALARAQAADKQVIFMKVGSSSAGAAAAASHTAALSGDDRIWDAVFHKYGVYRAHSPEEQVDVAYAAARRVFPAGRKLGVLSVSGGFGIQLCDTAAQYDLDISPLPTPAAERLRTLLPFGSINNPLDASGQVVAHLESLTESLCVLGNQGGYDAVVSFFGTVPLTADMAEPLFQAASAAAPRLVDKLMVFCLIGDEATVRAYERKGYLVFADPARAVRAIAAMAELAAGRRRDDAELAVSAPTDFGDAALSEFSAKSFLAQAGIPVPPERLARSASEAVAAAEALGYPVAMKICSAAIAHKTEIGGVLLSVADAQAVAEGYDALIGRAGAAGYSSGLVEGVIVTPMAAKGIETILGVQNDPTFGPAVLFGLGGIHAEVLKDVSIRLAPVSEAEAHEMIREIRAWPLLAGVRGAKPADVDALARAISALSRFAAANADRLASIDINPFVVWDQGKGAAALDGLVALKPRQPVRALSTATA